jgi:predicted TIM-barrel fold metal-dependent hydrolase
LRGDENLMTAGDLSGYAIDCDIHPGVPDTDALLPYMDAYWQDQFVSRGIEALELASYPPNAPLSCRPDWRPERGRPGSDIAMLRSQALDAFGIRLAICNTLYGPQVQLSETMAAAACRAVNEWITREWLDREPRLRSSIVVSGQSPELAAEEIEHRAADRRFVQVLVLAANELLLGRRYYWPLYRAAERFGLPIGIHAGTMYRYAPTPNGWPSHYLHDYAANSNLFASQLHSLISEGVFGTFPGLKVVLLESGVTWLTGFMWRSDKTWRGTRGEVPWLKQPPSQIVRDHVRLSVQPMDAPKDAGLLARVLDQLGSEDMLLFSTDYPHWQFDGDDAMPPGLPPNLRRKIMSDNPLATYPRLREQLS